MVAELRPVALCVRAPDEARQLRTVRWLRAARRRGGDFPKATLTVSDADRVRAKELLDQVRRELTSLGEQVLEYFDSSCPRYEYTLGLALGQTSGRVLDLGCSPGHLGMALVMHGFEVEGIDLNTGWLVKYAPGWAERLRVRQADVERESIPHPDGVFDLVLFTEVLEHVAVEDPLKILREIRRVLRPGGSMLLSTPNIANVSNILALARGRNVFWAPTLFYGSLDRHNREYTPREVVALMDRSGFDRYEIGYMNTWSNWNAETALVFHRLLANPRTRRLERNPLFNNTIFVRATA